MFTDMASLVVDVVASFFVFTLLARFVFQWLRVPFHNPLGEFVIVVTAWMVSPARRIIPPLGALDLASLLLAWAVQMAGLYLQYSIRGWEFGSAPGIALAGLAVLSLVDLLRYALYILVFAVIVQVVLSWVNPYSPVAPIFDALTRPFLRPIRRFVPPIAQVDLSPLVLLVILQVLLIPIAHLRALAGGLF
jgi:YggT family protein